MSDNEVEGLCDVCGEARVVDALADCEACGAVVCEDCEGDHGEVCVG